MSSFKDWLRAGKPRPDKLSKDSIARVDRYDRADQKAIAKEMREFRVAERKLCELAEQTGGHLTSDTFLGFYKVDAHLRPEEEMRPTFLINHRVQDELQKTPDWERLHTWTEGDLVNAAMAFVSVEPDLEALFDRSRKQQEEAEALERQQQEFLSAEAGQRDMDEMIQAWKDQEELNAEQLQALQDLQDQIAEAMADAEASLEANWDQLDKDMDRKVAAAVPAMRKKMADAADEAEEISTAAMSFGADPGQLQRMNASERIELAKRVSASPTLKRVAELVGPMQRIAAAEQKRKIYHARDEIYDIGMGNDLARVLPSELFGLEDPDLELDFYRKYTEGQLLQYETRGEEKVGRGGIIFCMDNSGSMAGEPEQFAKALGLAMSSIARDQKRSFYGIHFGSRRELMEFDFAKPEDYTLEKVLAYAEFFFNGGTDFEAPLTRSLELLQKEHELKGYVEGDIVFCTDGLCRVSSQWMENFKREQERLGFTVWGLLIGSFREMDPLSTICDGKVLTVSDILSGNDVRQVFRGV